jgi:hypothetical protein
MKQPRTRQCWSPAASTSVYLDRGHSEKISISESGTTNCANLAQSVIRPETPRSHLARGEVPNGHIRRHCRWTVSKANQNRGAGRRLARLRHRKLALRARIRARHTGGAPMSKVTTELCGASKATGPKAVLRGDRCQCPTCREYFNSTYAFDRHRVGRFGVDRRCLVRAEMIAKGMAMNDRFWVAQQMPLGRGGTSKRRRFTDHPEGRAPLGARRQESPGVMARVVELSEVGP